MKKLIVLFSLLTLCAFQAQGWGRLGHATIAELELRKAAYQLAKALNTIFG